MFPQKFSFKPTAMQAKISEKTRYQHFQFEISSPRDSKQKESNFIAGKTPQNFEAHCCWQC